MESVAELKPQDADPSAERERSTIEFPYTDLENAAEVVKGVHNAGGTACEFDQLAAELKLEAKGGGFRLRVNGAKSYGLITYERGGRISLTELGRQFIDPPQERAARVSAFLTVPLYLRVYEQFKGGPLPPQAGLERAIESMGVGAKVKDKARQVMLRSAKYAGFFDAAEDRLVKPSIRQDLPAAKPPEDMKHDAQPHSKKASHNGGGDGLDLDPLLVELLRKIPSHGESWPGERRLRWFKTFAMNVSQVYDDESAPVEMKIELLSGGPTSAA